MSTPRNPHMGSSLDHVLKEEGVLEETQAPAVQEVVAGKRRDAMKARTLAQLTALDAQDAGRLEDYARRLYSNHANWNLPAWIVDPVHGSRARDVGIADVLQAWPAHGPVVVMTGDQFDVMLDALVDEHCHRR